MMKGVTPPPADPGVFSTGEFLAGVLVGLALEVVVRAGAALWARLRRPKLKATLEPTGPVSFKISLSNEGKEIAHGLVCVVMAPSALKPDETSRALTATATYQRPGIEFKAFETKGVWRPLMPGLPFRLAAFQFGAPVPGDWPIVVKVWIENGPRLNTDLTFTIEDDEPPNRRDPGVTRNVGE